MTCTQSRKRDSISVLVNWRDQNTEINVMARQGPLDTGIREKKSTELHAAARGRQVDRGPLTALDTDHRFLEESELRRLRSRLLLWRAESDGGGTGHVLLRALHAQRANQRLASRLGRHPLRSVGQLRWRAADSRAALVVGGDRPPPPLRLLLCLRLRLRLLAKRRRHHYTARQELRQSHVPLPEASIARPAPPGHKSPLRLRIRPLLPRGGARKLT